MVEISSTAIAEIERLQLGRQKLNTCLRITVRSGGCSGLFYDLKLEDKSESTTDSLNAKSDRLLEVQGINLIVDRQSWKYVDNLKVDYSEDLMGGGFRFHNSQIKQFCGCGISFAKPD